jgi:hypothetical protein
VWDAHQNVTRLQFVLQGSPALPSLPVFKSAAGAARVQQQLFENTLCLWVNNPPTGTQPAVLYANGRAENIPAAYVKKGEVAYLWDVRNALPDSVRVGETTQPFHFRSRVPSNTNFLYESDSLSILFTESSLFDTLYLETRKQGDVFQIGKPSVPLRDYIDVRLQTDIPEALRTKTAVYLMRGRQNAAFQNSVWIDGRLSFRTKDLGTFAVLPDTTAPKVECVVKNRERIVCRIGDNLSGIGTYRATLNGRWLLMQYDYKTGLLWSDRPDDLPLLQGDFVLEVADNVENVTRLAVKIP